MTGDFPGAGELANQGEAAFTHLKNRFNGEVEHMKRETAHTSNRLHSLFAFVEQAFAGGNEMLILVTELTVNTFSARFIATFGSPDYKKHNEEMMLTERGDDIQEQIASLNLE